MENLIYALSVFDITKQVKPIAMLNIARCYRAVICQRKDKRQSNKNQMSVFLRLLRQTYFSIFQTINFALFFSTLSPFALLQIKSITKWGIFIAMTSFFKPFYLEISLLKKQSLQNNLQQCRFVFYILSLISTK